MMICMRSKQILSPKGLRLSAQPDLARAIRGLSKVAPAERALVAGTLMFKLENAIMLISETRNKAVQQMHGDGLTYEEIADILGMSADSVRLCSEHASRGLPSHLMLMENQSK
jgi:DNA-directed RNA polymerase specialized sigma24 family protein